MQGTGRAGRGALSTGATTCASPDQLTKETTSDLEGAAITPEAETKKKCRDDDDEGRSLAFCSEVKMGMWSGAEAGHQIPAS